MDAKDFAPIEGKANHYRHPDLGVCALRDGQTIEEFLAELTPSPEKLAEIEAAEAERQQTQADRQMLLDAAIARAAAEIAADDTAEAELKAAATREQTRRLAPISAVAR